ncbi:MAG: hypothetical protein M3415_01080, partial [Actinomycetota bacterium]|nr:hypothetical protein [Actinomycetota bacterium]
RLVVSAPRWVRAGEAIDLRLALRGVPGDLAGYETDLRFDTANAEFAGVQPRKGNGLAALGRGVVPLSAAHAGGVSLGLVTCATSDCVHPRKGRRASGRAAGTVRLGRLQVLPTAEGLLELDFSGTLLVDTEGTTVRVAAPPSLTVRVGASSRLLAAPGAAVAPPVSSDTVPAPDLTLDGVVNHADVMEGALEWVRLRERNGGNCRGGSVEDVNRDGCVDVADLQLLTTDAGDVAAPHVSPSDSGQRSSLTTTSDAGVTAAAAGITLTVNYGRDGGDVNAGDGICAAASGSCTLRAAIEEANALAGANTVNFAIGTGLKTITLKSRLPTLSDVTGPTTIDGYTQPGAAPNTDPVVSNAAIKIQVVGGGEGAFDAFTITSPGNVLRGLAVYNSYVGVRIYGSAAVGNVLQGNFIGTNAAGTYSSARIVGSAGILNREAASRTVIGGTAPAQRNIISGNAYAGIYTYDAGTSALVIQGNLIGLSPSGVPLINRGHGVDANAGVNNVLIGGTGRGERNVLSGNARGGVELSHGTGVKNNKVIGNYIGTDVTGNAVSSDTGNGTHGIRLEDRVTYNTISDNVIGGNVGSAIKFDGVSYNTFRDNRVGIGSAGGAIPNTEFGVYLTNRATLNTVGPGNTISNESAGVTITGNADNDFNTITQNSTFGNVGLGIDIAPLGKVNPNDAGDSDSGANEQLNFPELSAATTSTVSGTACPGCTVEVFKADSGADVHGEGHVFSGAGTARSDGSFTALVTGVALGDVVSSTATDTAGNTSEFSRNLTVGGDVPPPADAARDGFTRRVTGGWGSADVGGPYALVGASSALDVDGDSGNIVATAATGSSALLPEVPLQDTDLSFSVTTDKSADGYRQVAIGVARSVARNTEYRGKLQFDTGAVYLKGEKIINGATTGLGPQVKMTSAEPREPGVPLRLRMQAVGTNPTTVRMRVWLASELEPTTWQFSAQDSEPQLQTAGSPGVRAQLPSTADNASVIFSFDDLLVRQAL